MIAQASFEAQTTDQIQINRLAEVIQQLEQLNEQVNHLWQVAVFVGAFLVGNLVWTHFFRRKIDD